MISKELFDSFSNKTKEDLLKDMVKILNGEITKQDYIEEIKQWNKEREE